MTYNEIQKRKQEIEQNIKEAKIEFLPPEVERLEIELMILEEYEAKIIARGRGYLQTGEVNGTD